MPEWFTFTNVVAALTLIASIVVPYRLRNRQGVLTYETTVSPRIPNVTPDLQHRFRFIFDGQDVDGIKLCTVKLANLGAAAIRPEQIIERIRLNLNDNAKVLDYSVSNSRPEVLKNSLQSCLALHDTNTIIVSPVLLNPGDSFVLLLITDSTARRVSVTARIADVQVMNESDMPPSLAKAFIAGGPWFYLLFGFSLPLFGSLGILDDWRAFAAAYLENLPFALIGVGIGFLLSYLGTYFIYSWRLRRLR